MTPTSENHSPTPLHESINAGIDAVVKEGVRGASGPEAREAPQCSPSLVNMYHTRTNNSADEKKRKKHYWLLMSFLYRVESLNLSVIRLDLTTASGEDARSLYDHFKLLRRKIGRKIGRPLHYWAMQTREGNGVFHTILAAEGSLYVEFEWIREEWLKTHGASRVYVKRYRKGKGSRGRVSSYMVGQYMKNQDAIVKVISSKKQTFGFPVAEVWRFLKKEYQGEPFKERLYAWHKVLSGEWKVEWVSGDRK
jgi:hypothetical protein